MSDKLKKKYFYKDLRLLVIIALVLTAVGFGVYYLYFMLLVTTLPEYIIDTYSLLILGVLYIAAYASAGLVGIVIFGIHRYSIDRKLFEMDDMERKYFVYSYLVPDVEKHRDGLIEFIKRSVQEKQDKKGVK